MHNLEIKTHEDVFGKDCFTFSLTGGSSQATMFFSPRSNLAWEDEAGRGGLIN
jgi:hypothetical protein